MGLTGTTSARTPAIPSPVLHAYSSERKTPLHIPPAVGFYEESNAADPLFRTIGAYMAPGDAPPVKKPADRSTAAAPCKAGR